MKNPPLLNIWPNSECFPLVVALLVLSVRHIMRCSKQVSIQPECRMPAIFPQLLPANLLYTEEFVDPANMEELYFLLNDCGDHTNSVHFFC